MSARQHSTSQHSTSQHRARGSAAEQSPPRIMIVSCPDLYRPELHGADAIVPNSGDPGPARRLERVITVLTGFCPNVEVV